MSPKILSASKFFLFSSIFLVFVVGLFLVFLASANATSCTTYQSLPWSCSILPADGGCGFEPGEFCSGGSCYIVASDSPATCPADSGSCPGPGQTWKQISYTCKSVSELGGCRQNTADGDCAAPNGCSDTGSTRWVSNTFCTEKQQKEQQCTVGTCVNNGDCHFDYPKQWVDTGSTRNVTSGTDPYNDCTASGCSNTGFCDGSGACQVPADGTDPNNACGSLSCSGYYWGWSGNTCYYRADVGANSCNGSSACRSAASVCPSQGQGSSSLTCGSGYTPRSGTCTGTTAGACDVNLISTQLADTDFSFTPTSIGVNGTTTVRGWLKTTSGTGVGGKTVSLQCWNGSSWPQVASGTTEAVNTSSIGYASFSWSPSSGWSGNVSCRLNFAGDSTYAASASGNKTLTILPLCSIPTGLDCGYSGNTIGTGWSPVSGVTGYRLEWCKQGYSFGSSNCCPGGTCYAKNPTYDAVANLWRYTIQNLDFATTYNVHVRSDTDNGSVCSAPGSYSNSISCPTSSCPKVQSPLFSDSFTVSVPTSSGTKQCAISITHSGIDLSDIGVDNGAVSYETQSTGANTRTIAMSDNPPSSCSNNLVFQTNFTPSGSSAQVYSVAQSKSASHDLSFGYQVNAAGSGCVIKNATANPNCASDPNSIGENACNSPAISSDHASATKKHGIKGNYSSATGTGYGGIHSDFNFNFVECMQNSDCANPSKPSCNTSTNTCVSNPPIITINTAQNQWYSTNPSISIQFTAQGSNTLTNGAYTVDVNPATSPVAPLSLASSTTSFSIPSATWSALSQGPHTVYIQATDNVNQSSGWQTLTINKDTLAPTISIASIKRTSSGLTSKTLLSTPETPGTDPQGNTWLRDGIYQITINMQDTQDPTPSNNSGMDTSYRPVTIKSLVDGRQYGPSLGTDYTKFDVWIGSSSSSLNDCVDQGLSGGLGQCKVYITVSDRAGNLYASLVYLNIDYTPPTAQ